MATVPVVRTWTAGETVTAAYMNNNIRDVDSWLLAKAIFQGRNTAGPLIATGTPTAVGLDVEDVDSTGMHSTSTNPSRVTSVYPGYYRGFPGVGYSFHATGRRHASVRIGGAVVNGAGGAYQTTAASACKVAGFPILAYLNVGDYMELFAEQSSGGNLALATTAADQPVLSVEWVSN